MNVAASADVRMTGGSGEEIHFHFASRSTDTRLECIFRGRGYDDILCNRRVDGSDAWTGSLPLPIPFDLNSTYRIRAEWENNTVTFWIGTNDLIRAGSFTVSAGLSDGLFGLCTYRTAAVFDNVSIEPLVGRPSLTHTFGLGTNLVTLTAYDTDGQAATGAVTLVMQPGDTPTADAGGPYSADEFSGQVDYNGWRVSLDGSGSSDPTSPTNRLSYLWDMGWERFDGTVITTGKWIVSASGVSQSDALSVAGSGSWGTRYAFTRAPVQRAAGSAFEATVTPPATCHLMVGLKNTSTAYSYSEMPYAFYFHDSGYWNNPTEGNAGYRPAAAAGAVQALLTNGHRPEGDPTEDSYVETVNRGFDYLFSTLQTRTVTPQTYGDPDTNGNGLGLEVNANRGYQQGMVIDAIASTQHLLGMARTGIAGVKGAFYFDIVTDMIDALIFGQSDGTDRGGWRYDWNYGSSDNSISQWGAISLLAADNHFGIKTPAWVMEENKRWLAASFVNGYYCYRPSEQYPWGETAWHATQPSALIQMAVNNIYVTNTVWRTAETTLAENWDSDGTYDYQTADPRDSAAQWTYPDPHPGVEGDPPAAITLRLRVTDDSLPPQTAASTFMLTVAEPPHAPYAEAGGPYICTVNEPCAVSGAGSYDIDPSDFITLYEWDLDLDGAPEIISPQPATNLLLEGGGFMPVTSGVPGQAGADTTTVADRALPPPPVFYRIHVE